MRQTRTILDRIATLAALRLFAWIGKRVDPDQHLWLEALRAELDAIDGGIARVVWAVGGLRLIWFERRQHMVNATYRYGPVLLNVLGVALLLGLRWSLIQHYGSIAVIFFELTGCALVLALPMAIGLVHARRSEAGLGDLSLATLLVLGLGLNALALNALAGMFLVPALYALVLILFVLIGCTLVVALRLVHVIPVLCGLGKCRNWLSAEGR